MKGAWFRGRTGRFIMMTSILILITAGMFALASVFMAYDPDGHLIQRWLYDSRWALFSWRLMLYAAIAAAWFLKVRPRLVEGWPEVRTRLPRTELLGILFILATECVAWTGTGVSP